MDFDEIFDQFKNFSRNNFKCARFLLHKIWSGELETAVRSESHAKIDKFIKDQFPRFKNGGLFQRALCECSQPLIDSHTSEKIAVYLESLLNIGEKSEINNIISKSRGSFVYSIYGISAELATITLYLLESPLSKTNAARCRQGYLVPFLDDDWHAGIKNAFCYCLNKLGMGSFFNRYHVEYTIKFKPGTNFALVRGTSASAMFLFLFEQLICKSSVHDIIPSSWEQRAQIWQKYPSIPICISATIEKDGSLTAVNRFSLQTKHDRVMSSDDLKLFAFSENNIDDLIFTKTNTLIKDNYEDLSKEISKAVFLSDIAGYLQPKLSDKCVEFFRGREGDLESLHEALQKHSILNLKGPSGIGKTQLCLRFLENYAEHYNNSCFFINGSSRKTALTSLSSYAKQLFGGLDDSKYITSDALRLCNALKESGGSLIIIDNISSANLLNFLVKELGDRNKIILTSQNDFLDASLNIENLNLVELGPDFGANVLSLIAVHLKEKESNYSLKQLSSSLRNHPMSLVLAGNYFNLDETCTVDNFLDLTNRDANSIIQVTECERVIVDYFQKNDPGIYYFLLICSFLYSEKIHEWVFTLFMEVLPQSLKSKIVSYYGDWLSTHQILDRCCLVKSTFIKTLLPENQKVFQMSPQLQNDLRSIFSNNEQRNITRKTLNNLVDIIYKIFDKVLPVKKLHLCEHIYSIYQNTAQEYFSNDPRILTLLIKSGTTLVSNHSFDEAILHFEAARQFSLEFLSQEESRSLLLGHTRALHMRGRNNEAEKLIREGISEDHSDDLFMIEIETLLCKIVKVYHMEHLENKTPNYDHTDNLNTGIKCIQNAKEIALKLSDYNKFKLADLYLLECIFITEFRDQLETASYFRTRKDSIEKARDIIDSTPDPPKEQGEQAIYNRFLNEYASVLTERASIEQNILTELEEFNIYQKINQAINSSIQNAGTDLRRDVAFNYGRLAELQQAFGRSEQAIQNYKTSIRIYEELGDDGMSSVYRPVLGRLTAQITEQN